MNTPAEANPSLIHPLDGLEPAPAPTGSVPPSFAGEHPAAFAPNGHHAPGVEEADWWPLAAALLRRWVWLLAGGVLCAGLLFEVSWHYFRPRYTAVAELVSYQSPNVEEVFHPRQSSARTFADFFQSPEMLARVSAKTRPQLAPAALARAIRWAPDHDNEVLMVVANAGARQGAVDLANLCARVAVDYTKEAQAREATEVNQYLSDQLALLDKEIRALDEQTTVVTTNVAEPMVVIPPPNNPGLERLVERLQTMREDLADLLSKYTEDHPLVREQRQKVALMEKEVVKSRLGLLGAARLSAPGLTNVPVRMAATRGASDRWDYELIASKLQALEASRLNLLARQQGAQLFIHNPAGSYQILAPATPDKVLVKGRWLKVVFFTGFGAGVGVVVAGLLVLLLELLDDRLGSAADVRRVTGLPIIAALGDLDRLDAGARRHWAFRTLTALQSQMSASPNHGLVCGLTSSAPGEGRTAWIQLLAEAACERGFRVLTIATRPTSPQWAAMEEAAPEPGAAAASPPAPATNSVLHTSSLLATPTQVTQKLMGPEPQPHVHIPLPGWVWNLDRRKQWKAALQHWRQIDNVVILVELPPASVPEAVLLAESLPQVLWLADCGRADARQTRHQLETLRHARCTLAGAVLNHAGENPLQHCFPRWRPA